MNADVFFFLSIGFIMFVFVWKGIKIIPEQQVWILEKLGKFDRKLEPGLRLIVPFIEYVAYKHSLKEQAIDINAQSVITNDNVTMSIDGVLYVRIIDPVAASYGVMNPYYAVTQMAQTTMRSQIGKMAMDQTFEERDTVNANIVHAINDAARTWGVQCMRYEIRDITPPGNVLKAMEMQVSAERQKRAEILESEGKRQAQINIAEGQKQETVLKSEGALLDQINRAKGEGEAILLVANATASGIKSVAEAIESPGGTSAVSLRVAESYIEAFKNLAKENNTLIIPANTNNVAGMVAEALTVFENIKKSSDNSAK